MSVNGLIFISAFEKAEIKAALVLSFFFIKENGKKIVGDLIEKGDFVI